MRAIVLIPLLVWIPASFAGDRPVSTILRELAAARQPYLDLMSSISDGETSESLRSKMNDPRWREELARGLRSALTKVVRLLGELESAAGGDPKNLAAIREFAARIYGP